MYRDLFETNFYFSIQQQRFVIAFKLKYNTQLLIFSSLAEKVWETRIGL